LLFYHTLDTLDAICFQHLAVNKQQTFSHLVQVDPRETNRPRADTQRVFSHSKQAQPTSTAADASPQHAAPANKLLAKLCGTKTCKNSFRHGWNNYIRNFITKVGQSNLEKTKFVLWVISAKANHFDKEVIFPAIPQILFFSDLSSI